MSSMARLVSLTVLTVLIVFLGITFYQIVAPFLLPLFLAGMMAVICKPLFAYYCLRTNGRIRVAAGLTTGTVLTTFLLPLLVGTILAALQLYSMASGYLGSPQWTRTVARLRREIGFDQYAAELRSLISGLPESEVDSSDAAVEPDTPIDEPTTEADEPRLQLDNRDSGSQQGTQARQGTRGGEESRSVGPSTAKSPAEESPTRASSAVKSDSKNSTAPQLPSANPSDRDETDVVQVVPQSPPDEKSIEEPVPAESEAASTKPPTSPKDERAAQELQDQIESHLKGALMTLSQRTLGVVGAVRGAAFNILEVIISLTVGALTFAIALYYFLADGPALIAASERLIPMHAAYQRALLAKFDTVVRSIVLATFLAATVQGLLTAIALSIAGFEPFLFLLLISTFVALVPLLGTWLVWGPCAVLLAYQGHWMAAGSLTLFGAVVVGTLDNLIRTYVLQGDTKLHPLLAFMSVLGGLQVLGLWGMFVGPIVATCLHALVQIFNMELKEFSQSRGAAAEADVASPNETTSAGDIADRAASDANAAASPPEQSHSPAASESTPQHTEAAKPAKQGKKRRRRRKS